MEITFHSDSTASLGSFIQVLAGRHPIGRIFPVNNVYRFSPGDEPSRGDEDMQDEDLERLAVRIRTRYQPAE